MPSQRGRDVVARHFALIRGVGTDNLLRGAARAGATVIADEAKRLLGDKRATVEGGAKALIRDAINIRMDTRDGRIIAWVEVSGPGTYVARFLEWGTEPHYIRVADADRKGRTVSRINRQSKDGTLVIAGKPVGPVVFHTGADKHPFLRPAFDMKADEAASRAQSYVNSKIGVRP